IDSVEEPLVQLRVGPRIEQPAVGRETVTTRPSDLLVPRLCILRHVAMDDVADVRLVDAHSERDRRYHHIDIITRKRFLVARPFHIRQTCMVRQRTYPLVPKEIARLFDTATRKAVDDTT